MRSTEALRTLAEASASQWGMVTAAQAAVLGVGRLDLSRLAQGGHLERLAHGVYRDAGAPADEFESLRVAWLSADPGRTAEDRLRDQASGFVVAGASAASLHGVGDLPADRHELNSPQRRQTQRQEITYRRRRLDQRDVTIMHGLPVTTIERTVADLVEARTDLSLVADVLRDASRLRDLDHDLLAELLGPLAARNGLHKNDGTALRERLITIAGLDTASRAQAIGASEKLSALVAASALARLDSDDFGASQLDEATKRAVHGLTESFAQWLALAAGPAIERLAASAEDRGLPSGPDVDLEDLGMWISVHLPTEELLGSFGREWALALEAPLTSQPAAVEANAPRATVTDHETVGARG